jgi:hypothetical protein
MDCARVCVRTDDYRFRITPLSPIITDGSEGIFMPQNPMPPSSALPAILSILCSIAPVAHSLPLPQKEYAL